ncbi:hypothetical protein CDAR_47921 [Caerostris darwini]|uniref:Uncharacterized protein n=1 Tax=Caerostris darwini TaxID=1538125 RepID=A0AAV4VQ53_9ARAC|nr:hypothetical protein CDAR_47921 [Caerostris darwini]
MSKDDGYCTTNSNHAVDSDCCPALWDDGYARLKNGYCTTNSNAAADSDCCPTLWDDGHDGFKNGSVPLIRMLEVARPVISLSQCNGGTTISVTRLSE